jgi:hypothetical protein
MNKNLCKPIDPCSNEDALQMVALAGYGPMVDFKGACNKAKNQGKKVVIAQPTLLLIDIDSKAAYRECLARIPMVEEHVGYLGKQEVTSFSGGDNKHIYIRTERIMTAWERCAIQLFLCSDPVKEVLSLMLIKKDDLHPILFFEKPDFTLDI